jgi:prepilin-type N-terminal cleavage/methylation domain-containing protein
MRKDKGFTLIELLVVIAIIGLLSSIILASLNSARAKGADASIKSNLKNLQTQAELFYDTASTYTGLCDDATIEAAINNAKSAAGISAATNEAIGTAGSATTATCHVQTAAPAGANYAIEVPLKTNSAVGWCVDNTGASKQVSTHLIANDVTCN